MRVESCNGAAELEVLQLINEDVGEEGVHVARALGSTVLPDLLP